MKPHPDSPPDMHGETWAYLIVFFVVYVVPVIIYFAARHNRTAQKQQQRAEQFARLNEEKR